MNGGTRVCHITSHFAVLEVLLSHLEPEDVVS